MPGVPINDGNDVRAPRYLDLREGKIVSAKSVPYDSAAEAWAALISTRICEGLRVKVKNSVSGKIEDWEVNEALNALVKRDDGSGGTSLNYVGDWNTGITYAINDVVNNLGSSFIAKVANTGITPANGYTWGLIAEKGDNGGGSGATPDLQAVTDVGFTTTNSIYQSDGDIKAYNSYDLSYAALRAGTTAYLEISPDSTNSSRVLSDNVTGTKDLQLPNTNGTLVATVNGVAPDVAGNVVVSGGGGGTPSLQDVADVNDNVRGMLVTGHHYDGIGYGLRFADEISGGSYETISFYDNNMEIKDRYGNVHFISFPGGNVSGTENTQYYLPLIGAAILSSGTVIVSNSHVGVGNRIFVSCLTPSGTQGFLSVPNSGIISHTSFTINSSSASDNSTVSWMIIKY